MLKTAQRKRVHLKKSWTLFSKVDIRKQGGIFERIEVDMKTLHALLHSFREEELELIRSLIKSDKDDGASKTLQLFDAVKSSDVVPTRKEMARLIYDAPPDTNAA